MTRIGRNKAPPKCGDKGVESLKYMNIPWVFVEPTRLKMGKGIPRKQKNEVEEDELAFLKMTGMGFTDDDMSLLREALDGQKFTAETHPKEFDDALEVIRERHIRQEEEAERVRDIPVVPVVHAPDDDEDLLTPRDDDNGLFTDDLDDSDTYEERLASDTPEKIQTVIMNNIREELTARNEGPRPFKAFTFSDSLPEDVAVTHQSQRMSEGRRRIVEAVEQASPLGRVEREPNSLVNQRSQNDSALRRAALANCFGAQSFRSYLEQQNMDIPASLHEVKGVTPTQL